MEFKTWIKLAAVGVTTLAVGCSFGGSSSKGFLSAGATTGGATAGAITSALPSNTRSANGYDFNALYEPAGSVPGASFDAMERVGSDTIAAESPFSNIDRVTDAGTAISEGTLFFDARDLITSQGAVLGSTANTQSPGAGDLWERSSGGLWSIRLDSGDNEMVAADSATGTWAAHGSQGTGNRMTVRFDDGTGFASVAMIDSSIPTAAIEFAGELWLGAANSDDNGGQAKLWRGTQALGFVEEAELPLPAVGIGVRQQVTDFMTISAVITGTVTKEFLVVATGSYSMNTGQPLSGEVMITDGAGVYEVISTFNAVPTCVAWHDNTIYVGLSDGRLCYREDNGAWGSETGVGMTTVGSLAVNTAGNLLIGGGTSTGSAVFVRTVAAGPVNPNPLYFVDDLAPLLAGNCASCHNGLVPAAEAVYSLADPADNTLDFTATQGKIDTANPAVSLLLLKASNDSSTGGHVGGELWAVGSVAHTTVLTWIQQGAVYEAPVAPPPPAPIPSTFASIYTFLVADCSGCHSSGAGGFTANANDVTASYNGARNSVDVGTPENSKLLRAPRGLNHPGGPIKVPQYNVGSTKYNAILKWIADGRLQ